MTHQPATGESLAATLFTIDGVADYEFSFRVLRVREVLPHDNLRSQRLQKWADHLWREQLKCPVYPTNRFGFPGFLVPEATSPAVGTVLQVHDVPDRLYHIRGDGPLLRGEPA